jgi:hypothetical protein
VVVDPQGRALRVADAIARDPLLGPREREVLQDVYRALVNQRGRDPRQPDFDDQRYREPWQNEPDDHDLGPGSFQARLSVPACRWRDPTTRVKDSPAAPMG